MIENDRQLAAALFQMESFADTLEGMRRHAQETEPSVFTVTSGGFVNLLRERIAEANAYVGSLPNAQEQPGASASTSVDYEQAATVGQAFQVIERQQGIV